MRTRGLPDDHVGAVRVVTIEGVETNMCCGTHVSNLAHLQVQAPFKLQKGILFQELGNLYISQVPKAEQLAD